MSDGEVDPNAPTTIAPDDAPTTIAPDDAPTTIAPDTMLLSPKARAVAPGIIDLASDKVEVHKRGEPMSKYDLPSTTAYVVLYNKPGTLLVWTVEPISEIEFAEEGILDLVMSEDHSIEGTETFVFVDGEGDFDIGTQLGNSGWGTYSFRLDEQTREVTLLCDKTKVSHIDYVTAEKATKPDSSETPAPDSSEAPAPDSSETPVPDKTPKADVTETRKPVAAQTDFRGTVCSFGPRFRDLSQLTDQWYRFTPLDLRTDGVQTFDLIADDAYVIGQATVTVADGTVTIECSYVSADVHVREEFCTLLPSPAETATLDPRELVHYAFGEPIGIADALNSDTQVLLMI